MQPSQTVLITGCSTGIGYWTSLLLARNDYRVFATMRNIKKADSLREAARDLSIEILPLDVDKPASVHKAVSTVLRKAGRIDALVNNAGWGAFGAFEEFTEKEIRDQYETNVFGLARVTNAVLPAMRAQRQGRIVNIGSLAGKMTFPGIGLYCSSKHAVEAFTEVLRLETRPFGIQATVVEPGNMRTRFNDNRRKARTFEKGESAYQGVLEKVLAFGQKRAAQSPRPEKVALTVLRALKSATMAVRYPVGMDSRFFPIVRWCLPDFVYDNLVRKNLRGVQTMSSLPVALVTGATSGFGLETSRLLAQRGYRVYGTFRNAGKCGPLKELGKSLPVAALFMDVTKPETVKKAVTWILRKEGRIDVLVNNAGSVVAGFLEDLSDAEMKAQFETNVFGLLRVTREVLPSMRRQGNGKIVNIGSISGRVSFPGIGAYIMSKFAVKSISEGLRQEVWPFNIEVCEIAPGSFATQVLASTRFGKRSRSNTSPYREFTAHVESVARKEMTKARPPSEVAQLILRALGDSPMKPVYLAGRDAKISAYFKWLLPDTWFEGLVRRVFPWSRFPNQ